MKKAVITILAVLYIVVTSGVVVNVHYCMGDIASVEYGYDENEQCGTCGMKAGENNCCHNEVTFLKIQDSHEWIKDSKEYQNLPAQFSLTYISLSQSLTGADKFPSPSYYSPPDRRVNAIFLYNSLFRI